MRCGDPQESERTKGCKRRTVIPSGSLPVIGHAGLDRVNFQGRLTHSKRLIPGNYTATVTTRDSLGLRTLTRALPFTIVP